MRSRRPVAASGKRDSNGPAQSRPSRRALSQIWFVCTRKRGRRRRCPLERPIWRASPEDLRLRSHIEERYGKSFIPEDMTIQDYPVSFEELEPHFDHFEKVCGTSGVAGNLRGGIRPGGNPFEGARSENIQPLRFHLFTLRAIRKGRSRFGYKSFPQPSANSSIAFPTLMGCGRSLQPVRLL